MTIWHTGQAWRVVNSLNRLNDQIRTYAPKSLPPATDANSWGSIADDAHSTSSGHYPHYYAALGSTAVVCARDFPHAPGLELDGHTVTEHLRLSRDPRIDYVIFDGRIFSGHVVDGVPAWTWRTHTGDPHRTHFHVSSLHTAVADSAAAWSLPGTAPTTYGGSMDFIMVSNPADPHNGGVYVATPNGPVNINPQEYGSVTQAARDATMRVASYARVQQLSPVVGAAQLTVTDAQLATVTSAIVATVRDAIGQEIPVDLDVEAHVISALQGALGQSALVRAAETASNT